jgi:Ca2+-binding RTX toxin-like protein
MRSALRLALLTLLVLPAAAHAGGTASVEGSRLVITGTPGSDRIVVQVLPGTGEMLVEPIGTDPAAGISSPGTGCRFDDSLGARKVRCAAGVTQLAASLGDGDDRFATQLANVAVRVDMGAGDDFAEDVEGGGTWTLGDGDDEMLAGSERTTVSAGAGNDTLFCENPGVAGRDRGERVADGGAGKDDICGSRRDDTIDGGAGDDEITGGDGDDVIDGGAGDDELEGDDDDDRITGGRGEDEIDGGSGRDDIRARDREVDDVACGARRDKVTADRSDDLNRCETVRLR